MTSWKSGCAVVSSSLYFSLRLKYSSYAHRVQASAGATDQEQVQPAAADVVVEPGVAAEDAEVGCRICTDPSRSLCHPLVELPEFTLELWNHS